MASMARDLLAQESVDATLERITASATELVEGCDAAGILVLHDKKVETLAPTHALVTESDLLQQQLGEGPCFDAAPSSREEWVFRVADLTVEHQRWPAFAPQAQALGVGSMMGFLLFTEEGDFGALNFYSRKVGAFTETSELAGWLLASHAAVAFSSARTHAQMEHAVATRHVIGEAMGILMGSHRLTEEEAFNVLRRYSQANNIKLREVARRVCEEGSLA
ncbi:MULTISPECIES: GAF and ANTAR domain-containing protein [unclassified Streptomyces]|uniref:GAF and ANTAR domain-containing protein n=1 Tax=unclassified Streptomyces TaxID=2593676 RepID=UPI00061FC81C|nr:MULTISPECIES: GAF and ANTAR domain-containing protein [unclassified Streptomyces]KKD07615.1 antitermination regulator [Streptomyces sp. WM6386]KKD15226.1 antitermination regulator [Streptomyces sp. WM6391]